MLMLVINSKVARLTYLCFNYNMKSLSIEHQALVARLIDARMSAGLSQQEVAHLLDKPQSWISKIENCQRRVDAIELKALANIYHIDPRELLDYA